VEANAWGYWKSRWLEFATWSLIGGAIGLVLDSVLIYGLRDRNYQAGSMSLAILVKLSAVVAPNVFYPFFPLMERIFGPLSDRGVERLRKSFWRWLPLWACWLSVGLPAFVLISDLIAFAQPRQ
jgi:hypothetical protein